MSDNDSYVAGTKKIWLNAPPDDQIQHPKFPARAPVFDEVQWADFVSSRNAKLAYWLWHLPDAYLAKLMKRRHFRHSCPRPDTATERENHVLHALAGNVYEHLLNEHLVPTRRQDLINHYEEWFASPHIPAGSWSPRAVFQHAFGDQLEPVVIRGHELDSRYWTRPRLMAELRARGLRAGGTTPELRERLALDARTVRLLRRSDLSHWGINRRGTEQEHEIECPWNNDLRMLDMYTWAILLSPYNPAYWLSRAYCFYRQARYDLAIGDAYRAKLLCEVLTDPQERNRQPGLYTRVWHAIEQHILSNPRERADKVNDTVQKLREANGINYFVPTLRKAVHNLINLSLLALHAWDDYDAMEDYLTQRVKMPDRDTMAFKNRAEVHNDWLNSNPYGDRYNQYYYELRAGHVSCEEYPYAAKDVDVCDEQFVDKANEKIFMKNAVFSPGMCKLESHATWDEERGVYATEDIKEGQLIHAEEPSARGHLNNNFLPKDRRTPREYPRCDNCRQELDHKLKEIRGELYGSKATIWKGNHLEVCKCFYQPFNSSDPNKRGEFLGFCPRDPRAAEDDPTCLQIAREMYHFRACGKNWRWLHDAMRPVKTRFNGKWYFTHTNERHGTVLSLLLREVFDITLLRREKKNDPHLRAHEIDELLVVKDPYTAPDGERVHHQGERCPFTLAANIQIPFDILLMLGVDIFRDLTFDTWVIQVVLRKLMLSVIPWDKGRRGKYDFSDKIKEIANFDQQQWRAQQGPGFQDHEPTFRTLYLFPGFTMFNHACEKAANAGWAYDDHEIPNRILLWAERDIKKGEEILVRYRNRRLSGRSAGRTLGTNCLCALCGRLRQNGRIPSNSRERRPKPSDDDVLPLDNYVQSDPESEPDETDDEGFGEEVEDGDEMSDDPSDDDDANDDDDNDNDEEDDGAGRPQTGGKTLPAQDPDEDADGADGARDRDGDGGTSSDAGAGDDGSDDDGSSKNDGGRINASPDSGSESRGGGQESAASEGDVDLTDVPPVRLSREDRRGMIEQIWAKKRKWAPDPTYQRLCKRPRRRRKDAPSDRPQHMVIEPRITGANPRTLIEAAKQGNDTEVSTMPSCTDVIEGLRLAEVPAGKQSILDESDLQHEVRRRSQAPPPSSIDEGEISDGPKSPVPDATWGVSPTEPLKYRRGRPVIQRPSSRGALHADTTVTGPAVRSTALPSAPSAFSMFKSTVPDAAWHNRSPRIPLATHQLQAMPPSTNAVDIAQKQPRNPGKRQETPTATATATAPGTASEQPQPASSADSNQTEEISSAEVRRTIKPIQGQDKLQSRYKTRTKYVGDLPSPARRNGQGVLDSSSSRLNDDESQQQLQQQQQLEEEEEEELQQAGRSFWNRSPRNPFESFYKPAS